MTPEPYRPLSYLQWNASRRRRATALWDVGRKITFEELSEHVHSLQRLLVGRGVGPGDVVAVRLPNVWQYVALELAIPDLGAGILPLPPGLPDHAMRSALEQTQPALLMPGELGDSRGAMTC